MSPEPSSPAAASEVLPSLGGFGATVQGGDDPPSSRRPGLRSSAFELCHVGVMLRALLLVVAALAIGVGLGARNGVDWLLAFSLAVAHGVPALILWLASGCAAQRLLKVESPAWLHAALSAWAGACALGLFWALAPVRSTPAPGWTQDLAAFAAGAALAAGFLAWMRLRARLMQPAAVSARLQELQSRIQPHFLFNTMNTAIALVRVDPAQAERVLEDLSELFRAALADPSPSAASTLREEVDLARKYLAIEALRFGERLDVQWELDAAADAASLPPLILQPLLENAVRHGVEPSPAGGRIRVRTRRRGSVAEITLVNTLPEGAAPPSRGHGIALANVRERLALLHDVAADFRAGRHEQTWRVDITVPM